MLVAVRSGTFALGYCSPLGTAARFTNSLTELVLHDANNHRRYQGAIHLISGPRVAEARNQIIDEFAKVDAEWLLFLDADMVFEGSLADDLIAVADPDTAPIVGGLCFAGIHGVRVFPTIYKLTSDEGRVGVEPVEDYPKDALVKVGATGAACLLIHRSVLAAMNRPGPQPGERFDPSIHGFATGADGSRNEHVWFAESLRNKAGKQLGEDIAFCWRAQALGFPVHVHTGIKVGHCKEWVIGEDDHDAYLREKRRPSRQLRELVVSTLAEAGLDSGDIDIIRDYLRPRPSIVPLPEAFELPEMEPVA